MNVNRNTRFQPMGPMPTITPIQKRRDNWLDALQAYWKIDPDTRKKFSNLFTREDDSIGNLEHYNAPGSEENAALMMNGYDPNLAQQMSWESLTEQPYIGEVNMTNDLVGLL